MNVRAVKMCCGVGLSLLWLVLPVYARSMSAVQVILHGMAQVQGISADFREVKTILLLRRPVVTTGTVIYHRDSHSLLRRALHPVRSDVLMVGSRVTIAENGRTQTLDSSRPVVRALSTTLVDLLRGDGAALAQSYSMNGQLTPGAQNGFSLTLTPTDATVARIIRTIVVRGTGSAPSELVITEASGDVAVTTFSNVRNRTFSAAERARAFAL